MSPGLLPLLHHTARLIVVYPACVRIWRIEALFQVRISPKVDLERAFPVDARGKGAHARQLDWRPLGVKVQDCLVSLLQYHLYLALVKPGAHGHPISNLFQLSSWVKSHPGTIVPDRFDESRHFVAFFPFMDVLVR